MAADGGAFRDDPKSTQRKAQVQLVHSSKGHEPQCEAEAEAIPSRGSERLVLKMRSDSCLSEFFPLLSFVGSEILGPDGRCQRPKKL